MADRDPTEPVAQLDVCALEAEHVGMEVLGNLLLNEPRLVKRRAGKSR
jgi:hypothetical protein